MDLICVDMDNTLIDSDRVHILGYLSAFKKNNLRKVSVKKIKSLFGLVSYEIVKGLYPKLSDEQIQEVLEDNYNYFIKNKDHLKTFNCVKETLKLLSKKYDLVLISNCSREEILISLKRTKINLKLFKLLIGRDNVKRPKPWPDEILFAERKLKGKVNYVIGDSIYDIIAGKRAKSKTIGVLTGNHSRADLKKVRADFIIKEFKDVLKILN